MTDPNVDALREKLRGLGYLDAGVDRFVLGPARAGLGTWGLAWRASVRIGVLGALLIGVPATIAVALRLPALLTGVRDALVVATYTGGAAGLATAAATLVVTLAAARLAGVRRGSPGFAARARTLSRAAGLLVGLACLVYLTLWWRVVATPSASAAPTLWASGVALAVAAIVALLLGHTTTVVSLAVLAGADEGEGAGQLAHSWRVRILLAALSLAASAALLALTYPRSPDTAADAPALVVVPTGLRLLVVGIDGFDPDFASRLAGERRIPTLARMKIKSGGRIATEPARDPVAAWMSIATGQPPHRHGATALASRRVAGLGGRLPGNGDGLGDLLAATTDLFRLTRPVVSSGSERREMAFWEVAARAGLRTAAVNWWTTWPALPRDGVVISDRAPLRLERGGPLQAEIAPPALYDRLRVAWPSLRARAHRRAEQAAEIDAVQVELSRTLDLEHLDLLTLYLPGLDIAQVALLGEARGAASGVAARLDALERLYETLDAQLGELMAGAPAHSVVLVTHPGRLGEGRPAAIVITGPGDDEVAHVGGGRESRATVPRLEDMGATVLHLLGLPLSRQLTGHVRLELLPPDLQSRQVRFVDRYATRDAGAGTADARGQALDEEMLERLRSLGYVR